MFRPWRGGLENMIAEARVRVAEHDEPTDNDPDCDKQP